ncbi:MAG: M23 family metallopeptidase [Lachnospiraceae bacterium]|nr:M23 family metallopeptidase [Lachnospiraceae bacterium]
MRKNNRKQNIRKERIIMIASSAFVMAALTMTGVYMKENSANNQDNGYSIDFTEMESQAQEQYQQINDTADSQTNVVGPQSDALLPEVPEDDLDYLPMEEAGSGLVEIPGLTDGTISEAEVTGDEQLAMLEEQKAEENRQQEEPQEEDTDAEQPSQEEQQPSGRKLGFSSEQGLIRPVTGEVLIPYSMDHTVYFTTLDQYKYNPATVYSAAEGTQVAACAEAQVTAVFSNEEIGQAVTLDLGNGYQAVYGQLQTLNVAEGDYVEAGQVIGTVAAPTIYYSLEGSNLYFLLQQNGTALDPQELYQ